MIKETAFVLFFFRVTANSVGNVLLTLYNNSHPFMNSRHRSSPNAGVLWCLEAQSKLKGTTCMFSKIILRPEPLGTRTE